MSKTIITKIHVDLDNKIRQLSKDLDITNILSGKLIAQEPKFKILHLPKTNKIQIIQTKKIIIRRNKKR